MYFVTVHENKVSWVVFNDEEGKYDVRQRVLESNSDQLSIEIE